MKKILLLALLFLILPNSIFAASESEIQSRLADEFSNLFCTPSLNADLIIRGEAPGLTLQLGTSTKMAGSIVSLKVNNLETVNADDHGREIQYAFHDKLGEYNNPTEAGASADKDTSSSIFLGGCAINDKLYTKTKMAYWFPYNDKKTSDYVMEKIVQFGIPGMPNVIRFAAKFTLIENKHSLRFEIPTGYHTEEFNQVSFYNLKDKSYRPSVDQDFIYKPGYKYILSTIPLIPVLSNGTYSLAPYSVMFRDSHYSQHYAGHTNKWSLSQNIYNITAGKIYYTESFLVIDSPDKIKNSLELLINSQKNFSIVSPYSPKNQSYKGQLHTHTTESDGTNSPAEVVTYYKNNGYNFISLGINPFSISTSVNVNCMFN